ncbi:hypothetical protein SI65_05840 [Aspergillus cristatus]|uniref:ubiquitinyl hydrolase 1 n=1 Tax=Aspergillus cristatus TaxID=573508 RepID=A0A1E3BE26_ASPCR|nr:hypothetical protein SI65_05840 [Aspergillus cristatus]
MRMRQLGTTQSIAFIAPPEVHQSILDVCKKSLFDKLNSSHVVIWLLDQTCTNNQELQPLYSSQGRDFCRRTQAATTWNQFLSQIKHRDAYMAVLQQPERQGLEELYAPEKPSAVDTSSMALSGELHSFERNLQHHRQEQSQHSTSSAHSSALEEVEQEREVAFEMEEREVQRPCRLPTFKFPGLHQAIPLDMTHLGQKYRIRTSSLLRHLYISHEFMRTVKTTNAGVLDDFTRPVNWILWSAVSDTALVIIPEEAELLIPLLREADIQLVHLLVYAAPVTRKMQHFNRLDFYATPSLPEDWEPPSWLPFELGILGGRLYFEFSECHHIKESLRFETQTMELSWKETTATAKTAPKPPLKTTSPSLASGSPSAARDKISRIHPWDTLVDVDVSSDGYTYHPSSQSELEIDEDVDSEDEDEYENENEDYVDEDKNDDEGTG